ncbi:unnamed protein product [Spirodela intermedia]|uniref:Uncharacterized protein n=1 Tax=Spirodela intermedia TaxID=51605 RepID=A0A7I8J131_SPIIN|nr:unnamed protein product [Spirodela intermedia]CAA6663672.1 unnamed protein product [Spirodela intermedia]
MRYLQSNASRAPIKFRMPTSENLVPIRLDIEVDGQRFKDAFTWNPSDPDSEVISFAKRTIKDLKLPPTFITHVAQSIQTQLAEFRSLEGQVMYCTEKIVVLKIDLRVNNTVIRDQFQWDLSNLDSDPEEFARTFPAIAVAIREQLYEMAAQNVTSAREIRVAKKGRRVDQISNSKGAGNGLDLSKSFGSKASVIRKRKDWHLYGPMVDSLTNEEVGNIEAKEDRRSQ